MQLLPEQHKAANPLSESTSAMVAVVISTRNRGASVVATLHSILANDYPDFEIWVIDQSDDVATQEAMQPFLNDPRVHYVWSASRGLANGRNAGIALTHSTIIAMTDDDCTAPPGWIAEVVQAFAVEPQIGIVFGTVLAGPFDTTAGFIPEYHRSSPFLARSLWQKNRVRGIGACMALRREVWQIIGGFDPFLGAGGPFRSCEDGDVAVKALAAGYFVYETPRLSVIHSGFRTWEEGRDLAARNWLGIGAAYIKEVKCGDWAILPVLGYELWQAVSESIGHSIRQRRIAGVRPIVYFLWGCMRGLRTPVDRATRNYRYST